MHYSPLLIKIRFVFGMFLSFSPHNEESWKICFLFPDEEAFPAKRNARYTREELNINEHLNTKNFYTLRVN